MMFVLELLFISDNKESVDGLNRSNTRACVFLPLPH